MDGRRMRRPAQVAAAGLALGLVVAGAPAAHAGDGVADIDVGVTGSPSTVDLNVDDALVTYTVTVRNLDPTSGASGGDDATGVKLDVVVADKPNQALPLASPGNLTPTQGASIRTVTASAGTCAIVRIAYGPTSPSPPFSTTAREYGETVHCDLGTIGAGATVTVTLEVEVNLNTFVVPQVAGAISVAALVSATNEPGPSSLSNNAGHTETTLVRMP